MRGPECIHEGIARYPDQYDTFTAVHQCPAIQSEQICSCKTGIHNAVNSTSMCNCIQGEACKHSDEEYAWVVDVSIQKHKVSDMPSTSRSQHTIALTATMAHASTDELIEAVKARDFESLSALLALGPDPNALSRDGTTPLAVAAEQGDLACIKALLAASASANAVCRNGQYPLRAAIMSGDVECVQALLSAKADVNLETSRGNPLGSAVQEADISVAELLLSAGARVNHITADGFTPLILAVLQDKPGVAKLLLKHGADISYSCPDNGKTAVDIAQEKGMAQMYAVLMQHSITAEADHAISEADRMQKQAASDAQVKLVDEQEKLKQASAAMREEVAQKVDALQAEKQELLKQISSNARMQAS